VAEDQALALIRTVIRSVWALELLLLMRNQPTRAWSAEELVRELRANLPLIEHNLRQLVAGGLVVRDDGDFRYGPASPTLDEACASLERAYRERPVAIVNLIVGAATDNVQGFADAFRLKRRDD
jgi:predicted transcriptional regulator